MEYIQVLIMLLKRYGKYIFLNSDDVFANEYVLENIYKKHLIKIMILSLAILILLIKKEKF